MGSHGGANAGGQVEIIAQYGITEGKMGVPILSSMDTVCVGHTDGGAPVYVDKYSRFRLRLNRFPLLRTYPSVKNWFAARPRVYPPVKKASWKQRYSRYRHDYARGIAEMAEAIAEKRRSRLPADYCLHVNELVCAIKEANPVPYQVKTTFKPLQPMDDAALKQYLAIDW
jgi:hypothetical protein